MHPALTVTEGTAARFAAMAEQRGVTAEEVEAGIVSTVAIGRLVTAEEVADVVAFLASPRAVAINGDAVVAGGGQRGPIYY